MIYLTKVLGLVVLVGVVAGCQSTTTEDEPNLKPVIAGYGEEAFTVGKLLYETDFSDTENWVFQIQQSDDPAMQAEVKQENGMLDLYMPAIGCTAWLNQKFEGPIAIVYQVKCPTERIDNDTIMARDINNFWHSSDPREFDAILTSTDSNYHGGFVSYHEMLGYYASTGGGAHIGNKTTRFRRYPRWIDGKDVPHLSLNDQDGNPEHLIQPGKWHTVQLVACDGLAQYIQDGKVIYEIKYGDTIMSESRVNGASVQTETIYSREDYPAYTEGYFGFRLVRTHHQYKNLKIYQLDPK
ncbi:MAG: DUF6250 domain-containing protein [Pontiella sp.]